MRKIDNFRKALDNLKETRELEEPYINVVKTGISATFEICFEQAWKTMKEILEDHGMAEQKVGSPKMIIKLAYGAGLIDDENLWLELLETRNILAHTYSEEAALQAIREVKAKYIDLFDKFKTEAEEKWL